MSHNSSLIIYYLISLRRFLFTSFSFFKSSCILCIHYHIYFNKSLTYFFAKWEIDIKQKQDYNLSFLTTPQQQGLKDSYIYTHTWDGPTLGPNIYIYIYKIKFELPKNYIWPLKNLIGPKKPPKMKCSVNQLVPLLQKEKYFLTKYFSNIVFNVFSVLCT